MANIDLQDLKETYLRDGFVSAVAILNATEAAQHRAVMESAESKTGPLHYKTKVHTILRSPLHLATMPKVLDIVEELIGPDILLYNVTYIVKEPRSSSHVSWHQDLTYWGLSHDDQVSMWLALSPATAKSGCMRMIRGSHNLGRIDHELTEDQTNVLFQGQTVRGVDERRAVMCELEPGQASFHHGWTLHASTPNKSKERRIGLNVQYLAAHVRQTKHDLDSAVLVRGQDRFHHFDQDIPAEVDLDPAALARHVELEIRHREIAGTV
jgi:ectoine hydroxylase-related dioxygenase (phytanoyl-CoA dioxygenase family)